MDLKDTLLLLHPVVAIVLVFPCIGIVVHRAIQVRQRRLNVETKEKSAIPKTAGQEHAQIGAYLAGAVVVISLLGLVNDIFGTLIKAQVWSQAPLKFIFISLMFVATIASLAFLYRANGKLWRGVFATLTGMGLVILGFQDGVYRKDDQWYFSHFYYGLAASLLMIFALAILPNIYQDRTHRWRNIHVALNVIALLFFLGQGITGTQALLEIPLAWQKSYVQTLYEQQCDQQACIVQKAASPQN